MTLFTHIIEGLDENHSMNQLDHWFDGFSSGEEAIEIYGETFTGETSDEEMEATKTALNTMFKYDVDGIEHSWAQAAIQEWNEAVWGQSFGNGQYSIPFAG